MSMNLESLASELREFAGITRKKDIGEFVQNFEVNSDKIMAYAGEDAAVIDDGEEVLLLAADGIWSRLLEADAKWAGYCAVLVNVHDIAAMGGWPLAMVDVFSVDSKKLASDVIKGLKAGIEKFKVPIIGGHFHPDTPYSALDVAILGKAKKYAVILSSTAKPRDVVVVGVDLDGKVHPSFQINWDTTSFKDGDVLLTQLGSMRELGELGLVTAGKDISNPGMLGTLGMLLESSKAGAVIDLDAIPIPEGMDMISWQKMYPGMGFVVTASPEKADEVIGVFQKRGLSSARIGEVTETRRLEIVSGDERAVLFDFEEDSITGINAKS